MQPCVRTLLSSLTSVKSKSSDSGVDSGEERNPDEFVDIGLDPVVHADEGGRRLEARRLDELGQLYAPVVSVSVWKMRRVSLKHL